MSEALPPGAVIYVSGPMSGYPEYNYPLFADVAAMLRRHGYQVINPAESDSEAKDKTWASYLRKDIRHLMDCTHVVVLPGWERSKGAGLEVYIARQLDMPILEMQVENRGTRQERVTLIPYYEPMAVEALRLTSGDRIESYDHPLDDYAKTAALWTTVLRGAGVLKENAEITPDLAILCMVMVKISRETYKSKRDNIVDAIGYLICYEKAQRERVRREALRLATARMECVTEVLSDVADVSEETDAARLHLEQSVDALLSSPKFTQLLGDLIAAQVVQLKAA